MQRMPNEVVDQQSTPADPQTFLNELRHLRYVEVMDEKVATHYIEGSVVEWHGQPVGHNAMIPPRVIWG